MSSSHIKLTDTLAQYLRDVSLREPDVLRKLREETAALTDGVMQITPEQGQFMKLLTRALRVRKALEVGTFTGYSAISVALALPPEARIVCCDVSDEWTSIARRYWREAGVESRIDLRIAPALVTLKALADEGGVETFDFAFIDADKPSYAAYLDHVHVLLRPGGLVLVDNVLWGGDVADPAINDESTTAIREFNRHLLADKRFEISMLPLGDGVTLALKI